MDKETEKRENKTLTLQELLNNPLIRAKINQDACSKALKQSTIFSFWENIAGKKLAKLSKPYKIKDGKFYITTKSATVSQQILFVKKKLSEKINIYAKPLGIEIKEIVPTYKNYDEITTEKEIPKDEETVFINQNDIKKVEIDTALRESIETSIKKINLLDENQKNLLTKKILDVYKAKKYRKNIQNG